MIIFSTEDKMYSQGRKLYRNLSVSKVTRRELFSQGSIKSFTITF